MTERSNVPFIMLWADCIEIEGMIDFFSYWQQTVGQSTDGLDNANFLVSSSSFIAGVDPQSSPFRPGAPNTSSGIFPFPSTPGMDCMILAFIAGF